MTFGRRHAGKGFVGFWWGIAVGLLVFVPIFAAYYFGILQ